jgi:hypothetical protein
MNPVGILVIGNQQTADVPIQLILPAQWRKIHENTLNFDNGDHGGSLTSRSLPYAGSIR